MTADWIAKRRELEQASTEGPWTTEEDWAYIAHGSDSVIHGYYDGKCPACGDEFMDRASVALSIEDAEFIADARTSLPLALKALEKVLEMHRENTPEDGNCQGYTGTGYGYLDSWCVECSEQSGREYGTNFPCPTVRHITNVLTAAEESLPLHRTEAGYPRCSTCDGGG